MNYLSVENITKSFGERVLFENISFGLAQGEKVALVGINGSGKSTLLKILMGEETPDEGNLSFRNDTKVGFLSQNPQFEAGQNAMQAIFSSDHESLNIIKEYEKLAANPEMNSKEQARFQDLMEKMEAHQLWDYESQVQQILGQLGIDSITQSVENMSGGQKKRVALAAQLIVKPDFLILDEPTNHLDISIIEWLESYLATQNMTLLMVTHDRYFLDRVCNGILEIDRQQIFKYKGNYEEFLLKKEERESIEQIEVDKAKNLMKKEQEWMRRMPKARGTKAKYRVDAFEGLKDKASKNLKRDQVELEVSQKRMGGKILELKAVSKGFEEKQLFKNFSYTFKKGDRIGIVGQNGTGKSTFLNILTGKLKADSGDLDLGVNTEFGYYKQQEIQFDNSKKVIEVVLEIAEHFSLPDGSEISASQFLNKFLFPPKQQHDFVHKLSGGEKRRLQLLLVLIKNPNFLILDEPTNDLDLQTLSILEDFLNRFQGCLIIVSHDRYFMDNLTDQLFLFEGDNQIKIFNGNYTNYRAIKDQKPKVKSTKPTETINKEKPKVEDKQKLSYKEKRELELIDKEIPLLNKQKEELEVNLAKGKGDTDDFSNWGKELNEINKKLEELEMRWLELSEFEM
ncbi:ABC-F family ATP-binding cassette domain-containing protein [Marivirga harenae]|uniref:ribosomal protection-like ABC-F family protein n=1 Tax=Marivirga harenae TaxID=2010992 RepID=UPI0026DFC6ED|nr:ABC-F family ATP-binding cassette domain-containing protein [Marivirga harenae]WKV12230.1 ABC-F family ATP-binding cassette domain-containing protein [Marivirga harenae]|tara:strand:+ start:86605 stop:88479 length:1875 start_codon:yes stop_codon:yes gene_type:complete